MGLVTALLLRGGGGGGGGGASLDPLTNPAAAADIANGKEAYDDDGVAITGTGAKLEYTPGGFMYTKHVVFPDDVTTIDNGMPAVNVPAIESVSAPCVTSVCHYCFGRNSATIKTVSAPRLTVIGCYLLSNSQGLESIQVGSIGFPVTSVTTTFVNNCHNSNLVVTIYVDATSVAGIPSSVTSMSPFGATNGTIVYRNSTTGEVITA